MVELAGRYQLGDILGTGGTATVYQATDLSLGVDRAVKVLRSDATGLDAQRARLRAEARAMARVAHPNILRVYDVGTDEGQDFVVMELAPGGTLQDRVDEHGPLGPRLACRYALQVLGALSAAHDAGVIHRDVKPQNVLLDTEGVALLADFGIALLADSRESRHTRVGVAMGSMTYMPPEQRLDARSVGVSADLYAVGATLYALLTGATPVDLFLAAPGSARWDDVPVPLRPVLQRATRLVPAERYGSAREMAAALLVAMRPIPADTVVDAKDEAAWAGIHDRLLTSLEVPATADLTGNHPLAELPPAPKPRRTAGVDPTILAEAVRVVRRPRYLFLGILLLVTVCAGFFDRRLASGTLWRNPNGLQTPIVPPSPPADVQPVPDTPPPPTPAPEAPVSDTPVEPAPKPSKPRTKAASSAAVGAGSVAGTWSGTFGGKAVRLELRGADSALSGRMVVRFRGNPVENLVTGTYDAASRRLSLRDKEDGDDSGRYTGSLTADDALEGKFEKNDGSGVTSFRLLRAN